VPLAVFTAVPVPPPKTALVLVPPQFVELFGAYLSFDAAGPDDHALPFQFSLSLLANLLPEFKLASVVVPSKLPTNRVFDSVASDVQLLPSNVYAVFK